MVGISGWSLSWGRASMLNYYEPSTGVDGDSQCIPIAGVASSGGFMVMVFTQGYNRKHGVIFHYLSRENFDLRGQGSVLLCEPAFGSASPSSWS